MSMSPALSGVGQTNQLKKDGSLMFKVCAYQGVTTRTPRAAVGLDPGHKLHDKPSGSPLWYLLGMGD